MQQRKYYAVTIRTGAREFKYCTYHNNNQEALDRARVLREKLQGRYFVTELTLETSEVLDYPIETSRLIYWSKRITGKQYKDTNREDRIKLRSYIMKNYDV